VICSTGATAKQSLTPTRATSPRDDEMSSFQLRDAFLPRDGYRLLPFRFLKIDGRRQLLVNDAGESHFLGDADFTDFVEGRLDVRRNAYADLKAKHFLFDSSSVAPFELLVAKYRTKKSFLTGFARLHIFVVTLRCEHSCHYCQVSRVSSDRPRYDMSEESASRALDLVFRCPATQLKIEFQGGEPLLNFSRVRQIVIEAEERARRAGKEVEFVVTTNLACIDDEILAFFAEHGVFVSTSLDGPADLHNANRPRPGGDSHARTIDGIRRVRERLGDHRVAALMTTTRRTLSRTRDIVDEFIAQGFSSIFLRPLSPFGFAAKTSATTGYTVDEFLEFYFDALDYIVEVNAAGTYFAETYAQLLLRRIFTPFPTGYVDLQSPAGAGLGAVVFNYDGDIYASDESRMLAEMGDHSFRLGNVHTDAYEDIFGGSVVRRLAESSVIESIPGCTDCAFQPFCGSDPVFNYATQGDLIGHQPSSDFHRKNFAIMRHLLLRYDEDATARRVFRSWMAER
jgi:His-Xaa-Ser system radical SAM maturase HxsB